MEQVPYAVVIITAQDKVMLARPTSYFNFIFDSHVNSLVGILSFLDRGHYYCQLLIMIVWFAFAQQQECTCACDDET